MKKTNITLILGMTLMLVMFVGCASYERYNPSPVGIFYPNSTIQYVFMEDNSLRNHVIISFSRPVKIKSVGIMTNYNSSIKECEVALLETPTLDHLPGDYISTSGNFFAPTIVLKTFGRIEYTGSKTSSVYFWEGVGSFLTSTIGVILVIIVLAFTIYFIVRKSSHESSYRGYSSSSGSYSTSSYSSGSSTNSHHTNDGAKEKRIIGHTGAGNRINPQTGVIQEKGILGYNDSGKRIEPDTGKYQNDGWLGWEDTGTRVDQESGKIQKDGWFGYEETNTRVNPETGMVQKNGFLGWEDTDKRIDPETGKSQHNGWFGWEDD